MDGGNRGVEGNVVGNAAVAAVALVMWVVATTMVAVMMEAREKATVMAARAMASGEVGFLLH
jgi:hypothetical protein